MTPNPYRTKDYYHWPNLTKAKPMTRINYALAIIAFIVIAIAAIMVPSYGQDVDSLRAENDAAKKAFAEQYANRAKSHFLDESSRRVILDVASSLNPSPVCQPLGVDALSDRIQLIGAFKNETPQEYLELWLYKSPANVVIEAPFDRRTQILLYDALTGDRPVDPNYWVEIYKSEGFDDEGNFACSAVDRFTVISELCSRFFPFGGGPILVCNMSNGQFAALHVNDINQSFRAEGNLVSVDVPIAEIGIPDFANLFTVINLP